jgi:DedD protein
MEQKKLLFVAISVGVFLVIVIGAGILVFAPQAQAAGTNPILPGAAVSSYTTPTVPSGPLRQPEASADTADTPADKPASVDAAGLLQNGVQGLQTPPEDAQAAENGLVTVTIDPKPAAGVPAAEPQGRAVPAVQAKPKAAAPVKPAPKPAAAAPAAPAVKTYNNYWVQAGSFSAKGRAEDVKETLAAKGITSIIENRDINGATYFRVRIGPYTSQNEADYWLSLVKSINGFEDSQVWQSSSVR